MSAHITSTAEDRADHAPTPKAAPNRSRSCSACGAADIPAVRHLLEARTHTPSLTHLTGPRPPGSSSPHPPPPPPPLSHPPHAHALNPHRRRFPPSPSLHACIRVLPVAHAGTEEHHAPNPSGACAVCQSPSSRPEVGLGCGPQCAAIDREPRQCRPSPTPADGPHAHQASPCDEFLTPFLPIRDREISPRRSGRPPLFSIASATPTLRPFGHAALPANVAGI